MLKPESGAPAVTIDVDPAQVRRMAARLRGLKDAFERLDDDTEHCASADITGHEAVAARLREFGSNWYERRAAMARTMERLAELADTAAGEYERNEQRVTPRYVPGPGYPAAKPEPGPAPPTGGP
jgi:hypothetical protein